MAKKVVEKTSSAKKVTASSSTKKPAAKKAPATPPAPAKKSSAKAKPAPAKKAAVPAKKAAVPAKKAAAAPAKKTTPVKPAPVKRAAKTVVVKPAEPVVKSPAKTAKAEKKPLVEVKPLPQVVTSAVLKPVKSILISQPKPENGKSPYIDVAAEFKIKLDWRPFTHVQGVKAADFRKQKVYIDQYQNVIFTSRVAIEQYFRICEELRVKVSENNRYFCISEAIALYLQKFIQYRKRKVTFGDGKLPKLMELILKHKEDRKFLLPCSDVRDKALVDALAKHNIQYSEAVIYQTLASDLSDLSDVKYDMLVFFNPSAIDSLYTNFPDFSQDETRLAIFGNTTADAVKAHGLNINIFAPTPENPSLVDAIRKYIIQANKKSR